MVAVAAWQGFEVVMTSSAGYAVEAGGCVRQGRGFEHLKQQIVFCHLLTVSSFGSGIWDVVTLDSKACSNAKLIEIG